MKVNEAFKQIMGGRRSRTKRRKTRKTRKNKIAKRRKTRGGKGPTEDSAEFGEGSFKTSTPTKTSGPPNSSASPFSKDAAKLSTVKRVLSSLTKELEGFSGFSEFPSSYGASMDNAHASSGAGAIRGASINPTHEAFRF
jgi:hypothetical protein